jgi:hypothetical protein
MAAMPSAGSIMVNEALKAASAFFVAALGRPSKRS